MLALLLGLFLGVTGTVAINSEQDTKIKQEGKIYLENNKVYKCEDIYEEGDIIIKQDR